VLEPEKPLSVLIGKVEEGEPPWIPLGVYSGHVPDGRRRPMKKIRGRSVSALLIGLFPAVALAQSAGPVTSTADEPRPAAVKPAPAPDALYDVAAVVATGVNIPVRQAICGVGEVLGFFVGSVARLPVWALTLGDRLGSSEPLSRAGTSIVEKACDAPWIVTGDEMRALGRPLEGTAMPASTGETSGGP
jgi:hypothetical protein